LPDRSEPFMYLRLTTRWICMPHSVTIENWLPWGVYLHSATANGHLDLSY